LRTRARPQRRGEIVRVAQYIVDQGGKIVFQHDGEGQYELIDRTIARLLNASG
jgi:hypothetical protein